MNDAYKTRKTLIQRLKENQDEQSWEEFQRIYSRYIYAIIRNMQISGNDAEDLVQQVMIKVWKGIQGVENAPDKPFRSWLSTVTANCVKDYMRKCKTDALRLEKATKDRTLAYLTAIRLPEIEQIAEQEWYIHLANVAMERIEKLFSGKAIEVFRASLEGVDAKEIARNMGLKENSVYRLRARVRKQLTLELEQLRQELD